MIITRASGLAGAATASGATVVIDVFRAFSAAAYAFAAGAERIVLAEAVDEALSIAAGLPGALLMGEDGGIKPAEFDLGNSPGEIGVNPGVVAGRTIVHRSSSGTRCMRAAVAAGANPIYPASLVVASATAQALSTSPSVTVVAAGLGGVGPAEEDDECAELIAALLGGTPVDTAGTAQRVAASDRAHFLREADFTHPDDIDLCVAVDRFDFAMRAEIEDGLLTVRPQHVFPAG